MLIEFNEELFDQCRTQWKYVHGIGISPVVSGQSSETGGENMASKLAITCRRDREVRSNENSFRFFLNLIKRKIRVGEIFSGI